MQDYKEFLKKLLTIAIPIALQNFIVSSLNIVDVMMIGKLGKDEIAGVGLANQVFFVMILMMFGVSGGASTFIAQFWGKKDLKNIHKTLGLALTVGVIISAIFSIVAIILPEPLIRMYSSEVQVIKYGASYLRIIAFTFVITSIYFQYATATRSIGKANTPLFTSFIAVIINIVLNYLLIFGKFGFPKLGVEGAALATAVARTFETGLLLIILYARKMEVASSIKELFSWKIQFVKKFLKVSFPIVSQELLWSLGVTSYYAIYGRIGSEAVASINIASSVERMAFVLFFGLAMASGVIIGGEIGKGNDDVAYEYAKKVSFIFPLITLFFSILIFFLRKQIVGYYSIPTEVKHFSEMILLMFCFIFPLKVLNLTIIIGVLRSGGDSKNAFLLDVVPLWLIGVPIAYFTGLILKLPVYMIYLLVSTEELTKSIFGIRRLFSKKWMINLVNDVE